MQLDQLIPRDLATLFYLAVATSLGWLGGWIARRRREPVELDKLRAETRQIDTNTDLTLIQATASAITKAERLQNERDHWEMKAFDLQGELKESRQENGQLNIQANLDLHQIKRLKALLDYHSISYAELDHPNK